MSELIFLACVVTAICAVWIHLETVEEIEYERVRDGKYTHQITVTERPGRLGRALGFRPTSRVFVSDYVGDSGRALWYQVPSFDRLDSISNLSERIENTIRQQRFVEGA